MTASNERQKPSIGGTRERSAAKERICFVICPIGGPNSPERKRSDQVLKHIIRPAAVEAGFKAIRADEIDSPGTITRQVIGHIIDADMVIADLTGANPNVLYELAIRHVIRKPVVQLIDASETLPFDITAQRTIFFSHTDLDSADEAREQLVRQIAAADNGEPTDNPVVQTIDLSALLSAKAGDSSDLAKVLMERFDRLERRIRQQESAQSRGLLGSARSMAYSPRVRHLFSKYGLDVSTMRLAEIERYLPELERMERTEESTDLPHPLTSRILDLDNEDLTADSSAPE